MKLLAIDYGTKRIGLAVGEDENNIVVPYGVIENKGRNFVLDELRNMCKDESVEKIIIGIPVYMDIKSKQVEMIEQFVEDLKVETQNFASLRRIYIDTIDEAFTSKLADQDVRYKDLMKDRKKGWRDMVAAAEILRSYMERNK